MCKLHHTSCRKEVFAYLVNYLGPRDLSYWINKLGERTLVRGAHSRKFVRTLKHIREKKIKVIMIDGVCMAMADPMPNPKIYVGKSCDMDYKITAIVHEFYHAWVNCMPKASECNSRDDFVRKGLDREASCVVEEAKVLQEMHDAGLRVRDPWLNLYKRKGWRGVRAAIGKTITSTNGERYRRYYATWYDDEIAELERKAKRAKKI